MDRINNLNEFQNYCNLADECRITIVNYPVCGVIQLEKDTISCGKFYIKCNPRNGKLFINQCGEWKYCPNCNYIGLDFFEILYCNNKGEKKEFKIIISVAPEKQIFKQMSVEGNIEIPDIKPDMEEILNIFVEVQIIYKEIIKTSKGKSFEGNILTGYKLFVMGFLKQQVEYIANNCEQSVHVAHFDIPFCTYIILPQNYCELFPVSMNVVVEDIFYYMINKRSFFENITLMICGKSC